jgi:hypothetical protein
VAIALREGDGCTRPAGVMKFKGMGLTEGCQTLSHCHIILYSLVDGGVSAVHHHKGVKWCCATCHCPARKQKNKHSDDAHVYTGCAPHLHPNLSSSTRSAARALPTAA